jgi:AhpD family alkylhydroperoxidase
VSRRSSLNKQIEMEQRINVFEKGQAAMKTLYGIGGYLAKSPVGQELLNLIYFRVSQINGCAYCLDMHSKDLRAKGEMEQRLYGLSAWREAPYYTDKERSALSWAEAVTACHVPDEVYREARAQFSEEELIDLTLAITVINSYNRINIAFLTPAGTYKVGMHG